MRYSIVYKEDKRTQEIKNKLTKKLNGTLCDENPEVVFTIGGDGTVLDAVRKYVRLLDQVKFVAINTGNLGFYTEFLPQDIDLIIELLNGKMELLSYPLVKFSVDGTDNYALNEVAFSVTHHLFKAEIIVDDVLLMDLKADGLCISTPTGSTGYNKSLKGAVVDPKLRLLQMVAIAPFETINNRVVSPLILSNEKQIIIKPKSKYFDVSFDRNYITYQNVEEIKVELSNKEAKFLKNSTQNFPKRLKEKFISQTETLT